MDMDFNRIFSAFSAVAGKQSLTESEKSDKPWTDKSGKQHPGTAVKGDKYTGKEADAGEPGRKSSDNESRYKKTPVPDEIDEGKKPDFLDIDKDGDKKEPMKKAAGDKKKDVKESTLAELIARMDAIIEEGKKPDFLDVDKDGDKEEPMKKAADDKKKVDEAESRADAKVKDREWTDKSGKKNPGREVQGWQSQKADKEANKEKKATFKESDCGMMGSGMSGETDSGMSLNTSIDTRTGRKTVSISADGESADQLMQMLKLAGMGGMGGATGDVDGDGDHDMADHAQEMGDGGQVKVVSVPLAHAEGGYKGPEKEVEETYSNEPNPQTQGVDTQLRQGTDLNKEKTMHKHSYRQGDNPMAMSEADDLARLEAELFEQLDSIKVKKPTAKYGNAFKKQMAVKKVK
jgi:hypothetical protein